MSNPVTYTRRPPLNIVDRCWSCAEQLAAKKRFVAALAPPLLSRTELIMAVGLVVDYMVHIVHYFLHQVRKALQETCSDWL